MNRKKLLKALLFPHIAVMLGLTVMSAALLIYSMRLLAETSPLRIASYLLAFYTLFIWCLRIPKWVQHSRAAARENTYLSRWRSDPRLRINVTLVGNVIWNGAYAAMQLALGIYHGSYWYDSLAAYYASLGCMRFFLVRHTLRHPLGEDLHQELKGYRLCGWIFLWMNLALSGMMLHMIRGGHAMRHHEITTIAMAAYTFTTLTMAIINMIRYRRFHSPAFTASKAISLAAACVSMLTLENTMLATFRSESMTQATRNLFLSISGGAISALIILMAIYMIVTGSQKIKDMENTEHEPQ